MLRRLIQSLCVLSVVLLSAPRASAQEMTEDEFRALIKAVSAEVLVYFDTTMREGIDVTPGLAGSADGLAFELSDPCRLVPHYDPTVVPPAVRINPEYTFGQLFMVQQLVLFYLLGAEEAESPAIIDAFVDEVVRPALRSIRIKCRADALTFEDRQIRSYFHALEGGRHYHDILRDMQRRPHAAQLEALLAGHPLLFLGLHEVGHHALHREKLPGTFEGELEADDFAVRVFQANEVSVTLALPFLQMFARGRRAYEIQCRLARIARADRFIDRDMAPYPPEYGARLKRMRDYYIGTYGAACD